MKISSKGRYAVRIMVDIARNETEYVSVADVAVRQDISAKYLENIVAKLVKGGLLKSMRGAFGGYKLTRRPENISIKEILDLTGDSTGLVQCIEKDCPRKQSCDSKGCWMALQNLINNFLEGISLKDLINKSIF